MFKLVTISLTSMLLITIASLARCDEKRGLSPDCKDVVTRMGDKSFITGQHMAGPDQATLKALQTVPPDDSGKFNCSILISDHPQFKPACDKLLHDLDVAEQLLAFVKVHDPSKSWMIPQVRRIEDPSQKHWVDGVRPILFPLDADGKAIPLRDPAGKPVASLPAIVIKPPLNGRYGPNESVVTVICGYNGDVNGTCERIQKAVEDWIRDYESKGHAADDNDITIGRPAADLSDPFAKPLPVQPTEFDPSAQAQWPGKRFNKPEAPKPLTAKQLKDLLPNAPREFRLELLEEELTDTHEVKERWLAYREAALSHAAESLPESKPETSVRESDDSPEATSIHPTQGQQTINLDWLLPVIIANILILIGWRYRDVTKKNASNSNATNSTSNTPTKSTPETTTASTP